MLPTTGALAGFNKTPPRGPLTFNQLMNILRDIVTSINSMIRSIPTKPSKSIVRGDKKPIVRGDKDGRRTIAETMYTKTVKSLEKTLHQVVQYLLYFRNTDGSFGEPMVKQNIR